MLKLFPVLFILTSTAFASVHQEIQAIEQQLNGRLGISAIDTQTNELIEYRADERFPLCSTFKVMGVAAILKASMGDSSLLDRTIYYQKKDLVKYSPSTEKHIKRGMSVAALCKAAITKSDNTAINLLMTIVGGPVAVLEYARSIGDRQFNLIHWEPELNSAIPGDKADTTTPRAMRVSLQKLLLGSHLNMKQRTLLQNWLIHNTTGDHRIRAGVPNNWVVADKTGSGDYGTTNDIAIVYPPHCKPIVLAIYFTQKNKNALTNESILAQTTQKLVNKFKKTNKCLSK